MSEALWSHLAADVLIAGLFFAAGLIYFVVTSTRDPEARPQDFADVAVAVATIAAISILAGLVSFGVAEVLLK